MTEQLQNYRLLSNESDSISTAFQVLRGRAYKGEEGQYFTPPSVVKIAVSAIQPTTDDRMIDPACGSGSFLALALEKAIEALKSVIDEDSAEYGTAKRDWSTQNLFAIDKDSVSVRLSKAYLSLLGDGSTHVYKLDALRTSTWPSHIKSTIGDGTFSVALTNPPFGTNLKMEKHLAQAEGYQVSKKWEKDPDSGEYMPIDEYTDRELGIVFLERCLRLLESNGRVGIVLPDTYLFSPRYQWLVQWLCTNFTISHSINVPIEAFEPYCRAKTSILVVVNTKPDPDHEIVGSLTESYGEDKHGNPLYRLDDAGNQTSVLEDEMSEAAPLLSNGSQAESKLYFKFRQAEAKEAGVLVASYFWRRPYIEALTEFAANHKCQLLTIRELIAGGDIETHYGHGSPRSQFKGMGTVPYIKVSDIKNWRVNENSKYFIPIEEANRLRSGKHLQPFDIVTPTRASKNIGLPAILMPWQTNVVMTKEILIVRCAETSRISPWSLLVMMSLQVVNDQFKYLVQMQTNREDLGKRFEELLIPIPLDEETQDRWEGHARRYFEAIIDARKEYEGLIEDLESTHFVDRP